MSSSAYGITDQSDINVLWVRSDGTLLFLSSGLPGLIPYVICWLIMPEGRDEPARA